MRDCMQPERSTSSNISGRWREIHVPFSSAVHYDWLSDQKWIKSLLYGNLFGKSRELITKLITYFGPASQSWWIKKLNGELVWGPGNTFQIIFKLFSTNWQLLFLRETIFPPSHPVLMWNLKFLNSLILIPTWRVMPPGPPSIQNFKKHSRW